MRAAVLVRHGAPRRLSSCASCPTPEPAAGSSAHRRRSVRTELRRRLGAAGHLPGRAADPVRDRLRGRRPHRRARRRRHDARGGQRVAALTRFGGYATHAVTDARAVVPIPDDMDVGVAAAAADAGLHGVLLRRGDGAAASRRPRSGAGRRRRRRHAAGAALQAPRLHRLRHRRLGREDRVPARARRRPPDQLPREDFADAVRRCAATTASTSSSTRSAAPPCARASRCSAPAAASSASAPPSTQAGRLQMLRSLRFAPSFGFPHPIPLLMSSQVAHRREHAAHRRPSPADAAARACRRRRPRAQRRAAPDRRRPLHAPTRSPRRTRSSTGAARPARSSSAGSARYPLLPGERYAVALEDHQDHPCL